MNIILAALMLYQQVNSQEQTQRKLATTAIVSEAAFKEKVKTERHKVKRRSAARSLNLMERRMALEQAVSKQLEASRKQVDLKLDAADHEAAISDLKAQRPQLRERESKFKAMYDWKESSLTSRIIPPIYVHTVVTLEHEGPLSPEAEKTLATEQLQAATRQAIKEAARRLIPLGDDSDILSDYLRRLGVGDYLLIESGRWSMPDCGNQENAKRRSVADGYYVFQLTLKAPPFSPAKKAEAVRVITTVAQLERHLGGELCEEQASMLAQMKKYYAKNHGDWFEKEAKQKEVWGRFATRQQERAGDLTTVQALLDQIDRELARNEDLLAESREHRQQLDEQIQAPDDRTARAATKKARAHYHQALKEIEIEVVAIGLGSSLEEAAGNLLASGLGLAQKARDRMRGQAKLATLSSEQLTRSTPLAASSHETYGKVLAATLIFTLGLSPQTLGIDDPYDIQIALSMVQKGASIGHLYTDPLRGREWWHAGKGRFGYAYEDAEKFKNKEEGGWRLPSRAELKSLHAYTLANHPIDGLIDDMAYWTGEQHPNGNPYGYCFGSDYYCDRKNFPKGDALALLLVRER